MFVRDEDTLFTDMGGGVTRRMRGYIGNLMACEMTFKEGCYVEPHCHADHVQFIYVLKGKFELTCGDEKKICGPGDCCYANYNEMHSTRCLEDGSVLLDVHNPMRPDILEESK